MSQSRIPHALRELQRKPIDQISDDQLQQELDLWGQVETVSGGTLTEEEEQRRRLVELTLRSRQQKKK